MATEIQLIHQIMESFEELKESFELLNEKVELLQKHNEASNNAVLKRITALESKLDQLSDGHVFIEHMGLLGYQHKMQIIGKHGFSIERKDTHSELTIIKQDIERAAK
jgi:uncharacterized HAD superfamily protein